MAVWGIVLWRFFDRDDAPVTMVVKAPVEARTDDTLLLNYRDPFLNEVVTEPQPVVMAAPAPPLPPPTQHRLRFLGRISREGTAYGLVEINGSLHALRRGETVDGYRVETLWSDSARLRWKNEICVARP